MGSEKPLLVGVELKDRKPVLTAPAVARESLVDVEDTREIFSPLDIACEPKDGVRVASEQALGQRPLTQSPPHSTIHVSFEPPPCEELTTSEPRRNATRVSPPGNTQVLDPVTANGRRSTWRGSILPSTRVGATDRLMQGWLM